MSSATASVLTTGSLEDSYRYCRRIARKRARNFYYSFLLLERPQRDAMCAIYAFMRHCDDLSDSPVVPLDKPPNLHQSIAEWRVELNRALSGDVESNLIWPAFHDTVERYSIPHRFFHEMIDAIMSDLEPRQIQTFDELYRYCYQVASVVGLTIVHIFGFDSVKALLLAEKCGVAFQLTNILRDVREDAEAGRVYLPREDLNRFSVLVDQLRSGKEDDRFRELMSFEAARAREYYDESAGLSELVTQESRRSLWALREIYRRLLSRIERSNYSVLSRRVNLPTRTKVALLFRAFLH
ncbi:MAG: phytoene/squalene synthase family protein [Bryobacteraceae bacterium]